MLIICVVTDNQYSHVPNFLQPFYIGFALLAIGLAMGGNGGYGLNPARDLAPRLVSYFGGWGTGVFRWLNNRILKKKICEKSKSFSFLSSFRVYNWFWIFIVGPHIGAILGVCLFHLLLKTQQAIKARELDFIQSKEARRLKYLHDIELCNVSVIYDDHHHHPHNEIPNFPPPPVEDEDFKKPL